MPNAQAILGRRQVLLLLDGAAGRRQTASATGHSHRATTRIGRPQGSPLRKMPFASCNSTPGRTQARASLTQALAVYEAIKSPDAVQVRGWLSMGDVFAHHLTVSTCHLASPSNIAFSRQLMATTSICKPPPQWDPTSSIGKGNSPPCLQKNGRPGYSSTSDHSPDRLFGLLRL